MWTPCIGLAGRRPVPEASRLGSGGLLLRNVEVDGRRTDVRLDGDRVAAVAPGLGPNGIAEVLDGHGGALLPGLHDHHLHLLAAAAALTSVDCGPAAVRDLGGLARALQQASAADAWVRGVGYHESVAGPLDRHVLDRLVPDRPVRIQHRGGALWMLNTRALAHIASVLDSSEDVERDSDGEPNGRLWRYDARLRVALPDQRPDLAAVGRKLTSYGITGVTDATPDLDDAAVSLLGSAVSSGDLRVHVTVLGAVTGRSLPTGLATGPRKLLLRDHDLPSYEDLRAAIAAEHTAGRPVAVHCVTRESLLLTLAVIAEVGPRSGDRIEHASVVPAAVVQEIARLGLRVVTQPDFLRTRGDDYLREVAPDDVDCLYRHASLLAAGVPVTASSDAPFGSLDPWAAMRAAVQRTTLAGDVIGPAERVDAAAALSGYLSDPLTPGGPPRRVRPGAAADLCLLEVRLEEALRSPTAAFVRGVVVDGRLVAL